MDSENPISVSDINGMIKTILETQLGNDIFIKGEIVEISRKGGHLYFSLKDNDSKISCTFWRKIRDDLSNGDDVIISGKVSVYSPRGTYNITVSSVDKIKTKCIEDSRFEEFKNKSYFSKKREFPTHINNIAILTSMEGAAINDIMSVLKNNNFMGNVYLKDCSVQGINCSKSVKDGIEYFNNMNKKTKIDILVITRGGGGEEDLTGFSDELVVESIYKSDIFTISAIGHEHNHMLSDYAADHRAPTPSIAGETIIKYQKQEIDHILKISEKLKRFESNILSKISHYQTYLSQYETILTKNSPVNMIDSQIEELDKISENMRTRIVSHIENLNNELDKLKMKSDSFSVKKNLKKGYLLMLDKDGNLISSKSKLTKQIEKGEAVKIMFKDGEILLNDLIKKSV